MKIMITGGNGYVGRELCRQLYDRHEICVVDTLRYGASRFSAEEHRRVRHLAVDVCDAAAIAATANTFRPQAMVHLAAIHYIPECEANPPLAVSTNVVGTVNAMLACPPGCRFVYASSGAVYKPDPRPHSETEASVEPTDVYGLSKLHAEQYVRYLARPRDLAAVIVRLFNLIGPGETNPHLLPEMVAQLKAGRTGISVGNVSPRRGYIHVKDAASGFAAATLDGTVEAGEVVTVNLGTSNAYSVLDIARKLRRISGLPFTLEQDSARTRAVDRPVLAADVSRIHALFGWRAQRTLDDALTDMWRDPDLADNLTAPYR
jgi:UDP-glucose 4-epimerase